MRLTDQKIKGLKSNNQRIEISDDGFPMSLIMTAGGTKSFYFRGRQDGKSVRTKIGSYPETTLAGARDKALTMKLGIKSGRIEPKPVIVPAQKIIDNRPTLNEIFALYMDDEGCKKKDGGDQKFQRYEREIRYKIGSKKIADITHGDLATLVGDKYDGGFPIASNHLQADLSRLFRWSLTKGRQKSGIVSNPMEFVIKLASPKVCKRYLSIQEIKWFIECLPSIRSEYAAAFETLLYTACRKSEMMLSKWSNLDGEKILVDDTKNSLPHLVWLHPTIREKHFHFTGQKAPKVFDVCNTAITFPMTKLRAAMRLKAAEAGEEVAHFTLRDLRRTATTHMSSLSDENDQPRILKEHRKMILNHKGNDVIDVHYNQYEGYAEKKAGWKIWGDWLDDLRN